MKKTTIIYKLIFLFIITTISYNNISCKPDQKNIKYSEFLKHAKDGKTCFFTIKDTGEMVKGTLHKIGDNKNNDNNYEIVVNDNKKYLLDKQFDHNGMYDNLIFENKLDEKEVGQIQQIVDKLQIKGLSIATFDKFGISTNHFGNKKGQDGIDDKTIFPAASLGKVILAILALKLVDEGALKLGETLWPTVQYKGIQPADEEKAKAVTVAHVLKHTTGLVNWRKNSQTKQPDPTADLSTNKLEFIANPGTKFTYSGEGIRWLQQVIEKKTGKNIITLCNEYIFKPLGMNNTSLNTKGNSEDNFPQADEEKIKSMLEKNNKQMCDFLIQYVYPEIIKSLKEHTNIAYTLQTTAADYVRLLRALATNENDFLKNTTLKKMLTPQTSNIEEYKNLTWGLGAGLFKGKNGNTLGWHHGKLAFFHQSFFIFSVDQKKGYVFFTNSPVGHKAIQDINKLVLGDQDLGEVCNYVSK